jgi:hypothetical protein
MTITDDGTGFNAEILARLGEPYVTSRAGLDSNRKEGAPAVPAEIAKQAAERLHSRPPLGTSERFKTGTLKHQGRVPCRFVVILRSEATKDLPVENNQGRSFASLRMTTTRRLGTRDSGD